MSVITIVGSGMMGSAMSYPACDNGHTVRLVGTPLDREIIAEARRTGYHITLKRQLSAGIAYYQIEELPMALEGADLLIGGVSSFGVDWFWQNILSAIPEGLPVLSVTKGMIERSPGELISYPAYYARQLPGRKLSLNAIGGPCTSYELADRDQTEVCFCGPDIVRLRAFKAIFETDYYHISLSTDVMGVECAVALKNAFALGVTMSIDLYKEKKGELHYNSQAALFGQSIKEMREILALYGCSDENLYLGAGDLYVTVFGGRTRLIGSLLGSGRTFREAMAELEGVTLESTVIGARTVKAIRALAARGRASLDRFPLLMHIGDVMEGKPGAMIPWKAFEMERG